VAQPRSRYRPDAPPDYGHRFHAGNVGDVWKHCVLVTVLARIAGEHRHVTYLDTHAGEGSYPLLPTGEWTEGIGRLWDADLAPGSPVARYVEHVRRLAGGTRRPETYPGSPALARAVLGAAGSFHLWERDAQAFERLRGAFPDADARCHREDGVAALAPALRAAAMGGDAAVVALIDPPYSQKRDWTDVPAAVIRAAAAIPHASLLLWYPVKSLTRPNAMLAAFQKAGVGGTIAELVTTPLEHRRSRLNGSGVLLVHPSAGVLDAIAAAAPAIGARCATRGSAWSFRMVNW
jgi:23S rRNA (adenine2030-N6)-methyltransferase